MTDIDYFALAAELDKLRIPPNAQQTPGEYVANVALERLSIAARALGAQQQPTRERSHPTERHSDTRSVYVITQSTPGHMIAITTSETTKQFWIDQDKMAGTGYDVYELPAIVLHQSIQRHTPLTTHQEHTNALADPNQEPSRSQDSEAVKLDEPE